MTHQGPGDEMTVKTSEKTAHLIHTRSKDESQISNSTKISFHFSRTGVTDKCHHSSTLTDPSIWAWLCHWVMEKKLKIKKKTHFSRSPQFITVKPPQTFFWWKVPLICRLIKQVLEKYKKPVFYPHKHLKKPSNCWGARGRPARQQNQDAGTVQWMNTPQ